MALRVIPTAVRFLDAQKSLKNLAYVPVRRDEHVPVEKSRRCCVLKSIPASCGVYSTVTVTTLSLIKYINGVTTFVQRSSPGELDNDNSGVIPKHGTWGREVFDSKTLQAWVNVARASTLRSIAGDIDKRTLLPTLGTNIRRSSRCYEKAAAGIGAPPVGQSTLRADVSDKFAGSRVSTVSAD